MVDHLDGVSGLASVVVEVEAVSRCFFLCRHLCLVLEVVQPRGEFLDPLPGVLDAAVELQVWPLTQFFSVSFL